MYSIVGIIEGWTIWKKKLESIFLYNFKYFIFPKQSKNFINTFDLQREHKKNQ